MRGSSASSGSPVSISGSSGMRLTTSPTSSPTTTRAGDVAQAELAGVPAHRAGAGRRVGGAHVADDADVALDAGRQHQRHAVVQARRVAELGIAAARQVLAGDRALGEAFEDEIVDLALLGQFERRFEPVVRGAGAAADADAVSASHSDLLVAVPPMWHSGAISNNILSPAQADRRGDHG